MNQTPNAGMKLYFDAPVSTTPGKAIAFTLLLRNEGREAVDLYARGRVLTFDIVVMRPNGEVVRRYIHDQAVPAILRIESFKPSQAVRRELKWNLRTLDRSDLAVGNYLVQGELLLERGTLKSDARKIAVLP